MVCNQRDLDHRIWRSLDRAMVRYKWLKLMPLSTFSHLPFVSSDNCPLLLEMVERQHGSIKDLSFYITRWRINLFLSTVKDCCSVIKDIKFLHCWVVTSSFYIQQSNQGIPMWIFHMRLKRKISTLSKWSRTKYGDIYANVKEH